MTTYHNLTVKKRWFKSPQIVYKLIKYTEEEQWVDPYKVELADGIYQFPIATVEEVEDTYTDGIVEETNTKLQLSEDLGVVTFNAELKVLS